MFGKLKYYKDKHLAILWIRGNSFINYSRPNMFYVIGIRGSGKSNFLEAIGENYLENGSPILDLCDARDGEGLGWAKKYRDDVLILHDKFTEVECPYAHKYFEDLSLRDFRDYKIVVNSTLLYCDFESYLDAVNTILLKLHHSRRHWKKPIYVLIREAQNIVYARLRKVKDQTQAKAEATYLLRESRHVGLATGIDTLRLTSVDIEVRIMADFLVIKNMGMFSLPKDIYFLYSYIEPYFFRVMRPQDYIVLSKEGAIGLGEVGLVSFHKEEEENILNELKISIHKKIDPFRKIDSRMRKKLLIHKKLLDYIYQKGFSNKRFLANATDTSYPTTLKHIGYHNTCVRDLGYCELCKKIDHPLKTSILKAEKY